MRGKVEALKREINRSVMMYIIGCCCFVLVALASLWFGYFIIRYHDEYDLPTPWVIIALAGGWLLWEMIKAFRFKPSLPASFRPITEQEFPALFSLIREVTTALRLAPIREVYVCPDAMAAVFIQPQLRNMFVEPKKKLVIGWGFLTQMDDDEIRAMLYHEFGHYAQEEMRNSLSVYTIGQISRSFVSIKRQKNEGVWEMQMKMQVLLFTYFSIWICERINKAYSQLAKQMEYDADDVAVQYVGAPTLQRALVHAACIRYTYEVVKWGMQRLQSQGIGVDEPYMALYWVGQYARPTRKQLSDEVMLRVERLGKLQAEPCYSSHTIQQSALLLTADEGKGEALQRCSAMQFAQWLRPGFAVYAQMRQMETSVDLEIHLDKKKHKLPYFDGTYKLLLDGKAIGKGNFIQGYTLRRKTSPGKHILSAEAPSGIISTPFAFEVEPYKSYRIEMDYKLYAKDGLYDVFGESIREV